MTLQEALDSALAHHRAGRFVEAETVYRAILDQDPDQPETLNLLGALALQVRQFDAAIELTRKAASLRPELASAHSNLGEALRLSGRLDEAVVSLNRAIELNPSLPEAHHNLGKAYEVLRRYDESEQAQRRAVALVGNNAAFHNALGVALEKLDRLDEAEQSYRKAVALDPNFAEAWINLGVILRHQRKIEEALGYLERGARIKPEFADAHFNIGLARLTLGDYEHGWDGYEWRLTIPRMTRPRNFDRPMWDGSDLDRRTILIISEQGFGDAILAARYLPMLADRGARVIVECRPELTGLLKTARGVAEVIAENDPLPAHDVGAYIMSLPRLFGTTLEKVPNDVPYLGADSARFARLKNAAALKVGLVWSGRATPDPLRTVPAEMLAPLAHVHAVQFVSVQKGDAAKPGALEMIDLAPELHDFSDTASAIANLDLLITIDTAAAHLGGALGKPVWTLLPYSPDWRWGWDGSTSAWYPTMRLFRQSRPRVWTDVIQSVSGELEKLAAARGQ
ncbi:MAG: tetratricopeptide repeat protein [Tepidisphaeraceae bacterium]